MSGRIVCMLGVSLDGFIEGPDADIGWHRVDEELHRHMNQVAAGMAAFIEGRRTYELMEEFWPTADADPASTPPIVEFAQIWREKPKIVYSGTLQEAGRNATILREVDPAQVRELKQRGDVAVGGADLAATFREYDLIDTYRIYVHPVIVGAGTPLFRDGTAASLRLIETRAFGNGVVLLHYERIRDGERSFDQRNHESGIGG